MNNTTYVKCENITVKELVNSIHDKVEKVAILSEDLSICICRQDDFNIYDNLIRIGSISDYLNDINYMKELFLRMNNYNLNELYDYLKGINEPLLPNKFKET